MKMLNELLHGTNKLTEQVNEMGYEHTQNVGEEGQITC